MAKPESLDSLEKRYAELRNALNTVSFILQGSILQRRLKRVLPSRKGRQKLYGPYYQWTRKQDGRTVNINLGPRRAAAVLKAIREHRRLNQILSQMRNLSQIILESSTPDIPRRSPRKLG